MIFSLDGAGIVVQVGEGVSNAKKGDRVVYHSDFLKKGNYAEYAVTTAHTISLIPDEVSFEEAAAIPTAGYTAYQALFRKLPLQNIETVLIHGGAGGVGGFAVQLAKMAGKFIFSTASAHNHEYVKSLGADVVTDYREGYEKIKEIVMKETNGRGVDAVIDTIGEESATKSLELIAFGGHIAYINDAPDFTAVEPFTKVISFHEVALNAAHRYGDLKAHKDLAVIGDHMLKMVAEKKISPMLERVVKLEEVSKTLVELSQRHVRGKIVVKIK